MLTNKMKKTKESGMTLIETLIVITIGLVFVALALTVYGSVRDKNNVRNETENLSLIYNQTMDLFSGEELTASFNIAKAIEMGIVPQKMKIIGGSTVRNSWGGTVTVAGASPSTLTLETARVPAGNVCIELVRNQAKVGWTHYGIGETADKKFEEMTVSGLSTLCKGSGTKTIQLKYDSKF